MSDRNPIVPHRGHLPAAGKGKTLSQTDFDARLQSLRRDTGIVEDRMLRCCCSATGHKFTVHMRRPDEGGKFVVAEIIKIEPVATSDSAMISLAHQIHQGPQEFSIDEFDFSGFMCPWCDAEPSYVYCHDCNFFMCRSGVSTLPDGTRYFHCHDECGTSGTLVPSKAIYAEGNSGRARLAHRKSRALPSRTHKALPGNSVPRLNGGK